MYITIHEVLKRATELLVHVTQVPALEAEILLGCLLKKDRIFLLKENFFYLTEQEYLLFSQLVARRLEKEPIAYITNTKEFWSREFFVNDAVLIPRGETEGLIEALLDIVHKQRNRNQKTIIDVGTGSGAIAITVAQEFPSWDIIGSDFSSDALEIAKYNAKKHEIRNVNFVEADCLDIFQDNSFDFILANPPYLSQQEYEILYEDLKFEPKHALVAGITGLEILSQIVSSSFNKLKDGGWILLEHGYIQLAAIHHLMNRHNLKNIVTKFDLNGFSRISLAQK